MLRRPITSPWGLLAPVCLGVALESYEIWIQYRNVRLFSPSNDTLFTILGRHGLDIVFMIAGPILLVVVGAIFAKQNRLESSQACSGSLAAPFDEFSVMSLWSA